jgi:hypothetical protein
LAGFDADGERSVLDAAEAAAAPVFFEFPTCARSEPAAPFAAFDADGERSVFAAAEAAALPVFLSATIDLLLFKPRHHRRSLETAPDGLAQLAEPVG